MELKGMEVWPRAHTSPLNPNPFNGIERRSRDTGFKATLVALGIHSMELKENNFRFTVCTRTPSQNPFNGIESVFTMIALRDMPPHHLNPFNGIERQHYLLGAPA